MGIKALHGDFFGPEALKRTLACCAAPLALAVAGTAHSAIFTEEVAFVPTLSFAQKSLEFDGVLDEKLDFPMINLGLSATYRRYYFSVNFEKSLQAQTLVQDVSIGDSNISQVAGGEVDREEQTITVGFRVLDNLSVFGGLIDGQTDAEFTVRYEDPGISDQELNETYAEDGPFLGVSTGMQVGQWGRVGFSIAYALLSAENDVVRVEKGAGSTSGTVIANTIEGDTTGLSYSISWSGSAGRFVSGLKDLYYVAAFKINAYEFDPDEEGDKVDEKWQSFSLGVNYRF